VRSRVPLRDPLAARVENVLCGRAVATSAPAGSARCTYMWPRCCGDRRDVALGVVGVAVGAVVGHVAGRVVEVPAGAELVGGRVVALREGRTAPRSPGYGLRPAIAPAVINPTVIRTRAGVDRARQQPVEAVVGVARTLAENRVGGTLQLRALPSARECVDLRARGGLQRAAAWIC